MTASLPSFRFPTGTSVAVKLSDLRDVLNAPVADITDATVTMTLRDDAGAAVSGADSLPCDRVAGTNDYVGALPGTLAVTVGARYSLDVSASASGGRVRLFRARVTFE